MQKVLIVVQAALVEAITPLSDPPFSNLFPIPRYSFRFPDVIRLPTACMIGQFHFCSDDTVSISEI
jgi:hypothetical protein